MCIAAWTGAQADPVRSLREIRQEALVIQQWDISCGAAALATVLTYALGDPISEKATAQGMLRRTDPLKVKVRGGFSFLDMKRFAEARGYTAVGYRGMSFAQLSAMQSPIVPIEEYGNPHFVVVKGIRDGKLEIADPAFGNRRMSTEQFEQVWRQGVAFAVTRAGS